MQKEIDEDAIIPSGSSASGHSDGNDGDPQRRKAWVEKERSPTLPDYDEQDDNLNVGEAPLKKTQTHTRALGILKLRASDDDDPTDWWFASTAIPLIAATLAPMANVLSIAALVVFWRNNVVDDSNPLTY